MIYVSSPLGDIVAIYSNNLADQVEEFLTKVKCYVTLRQLSSILGAPISEVSSAIGKIRVQGTTALASSPGPIGRGGYAVVKGKESQEYRFCENWTRNWRKANNITPPDSPIL